MCRKDHDKYDLNYVHNVGGVAVYPIHKARTEKLYWMGDMSGPLGRLANLNHIGFTQRGKVLELRGSRKVVSASRSQATSSGLPKSPRENDNRQTTLIIQCTNDPGLVEVHSCISCAWHGYL